MQFPTTGYVMISDVIVFALMVDPPMDQDPGDASDGTIEQNSRPALSSPSNRLIQTQPSLIRTRCAHPALTEPQGNAQIALATSAGLC